MNGELVRQVAIPVGALTFGGALVTLAPADDGPQASLGKLAIYFGAQTGMNIYMKAVLSNAVVSRDKLGMPAPFMVTALQQMTAFLLFGCIILVSRLTWWPYRPKILRTQKEWFAVAVFSCSFVLNIALNNYSLSLIPISINLIIRSCLPLSTYAFQITLGRWMGAKWGNKETSILEVALMVLGVSCALLAVYAQSESAKHTNTASPHFILGVLVCAVSILSASVNLALAGLLGTTLDLNALDTTVYMAMPATLFLVGPVFLMAHPVSWVGWGSTTDWNVFTTVAEDSPGTVGLAIFSGVFALTYNALTYKIVQTLSAAHTAFAGSFNNAATICIALLVGMENLPPHPWHRLMMVVAILGNIGSFAGYNAVKAMAREKDQKAIGTELELASGQFELSKARMPTFHDFEQLQSQSDSPTENSCHRSGEMYSTAYVDDDQEARSLLHS